MVQEPSSKRAGHDLSCLALVHRLETYVSDLEQYEYDHQQAFFQAALDDRKSSRLESLEIPRQELEHRRADLVRTIENLSDEKLDVWFAEEPSLVPFSSLIKELRQEAADLPDPAQERLVTRIKGMWEAPKRQYSALVNEDFTFGVIKTANDKIPLTRSNLSGFLVQGDRNLRKKAYHRYYASFESHKHTLSGIYRSHILQEIMLTRIKGYPSTRNRVLSQDHIDESVHEALFSPIKAHRTAFHDYFALRASLLGVKRLQPFDLYVPVVDDPAFNHSYEQAVDLVCASISLFGLEYRAVLQDGLLDTWVDRYGRRGKRPGAFTITSYKGGPLILLNYKSNVPQSLFTLAHEAGHAMHSWQSIRSNPFIRYEYSVLVSEIIAAVHEELLHHHLVEQVQHPRTKAFLLERKLHQMTLKLLRQTLLAEFEHHVFQREENHQPMMIDELRGYYRSLLVSYYGEGVEFPPVADLEWITVDQLYHPYYGYTYPLGAAAAAQIAEELLYGGEASVQRFMELMGRGGSAHPITSLSEAGIALDTGRPVEQAMERYTRTLQAFRDAVDVSPSNSPGSSRRRSSW